MIEIAHVHETPYVDVSAAPIVGALAMVARSTRYLSPGSVVAVRVADAAAADELVAWCRWAGHAATVDREALVVSISVRAVQQGVFVPR